MVKESSDESTDISWSRTFAAEEFQEARSASFGKAMLSMHYKYYSPVYIFQLIQNYMSFAFTTARTVHLNASTPLRYAATRAGGSYEYRYCSMYSTTDGAGMTYIRGERRATRATSSSSSSRVLECSIAALYR